MLIIDDEPSIEMKMKCENPPTSNKLKINLQNELKNDWLNVNDINFETQPEALMIEITHFMSFVPLESLSNDDKAVEVVNNFINFLLRHSLLFHALKCGYMRDAELI